MPNALTVFLLRACNNILPTKDNLKRKGVTQEDLCPICHRASEAVMHTLWECPGANDI